MANLSGADQIILEKLLQMKSGYVLDFSNVSFYNFVSSYIGPFAWHDDEGRGSSKANRLRQIWNDESDLLVQKLLTGFAEAFFEGQDKEKILNIASKLNQTNISFSPHKNIENYPDVQELIKEAEEDLQNGRYKDVITKARTILEITFKEICTKYNLDFDSNNIVKTFGNIRMHFKMDSSNKDFPNHIKGLIANTITLVQNITEARNKSSSSHASEYKPKKHHAQFCLEQAISLMNFIMGVDEWTHNKNGGSDGT